MSYPPPQPGPQPYHPPPGGQPGHAVKTPWYKKGWGIAVIAGLIGIGLGAAAGGGASKTDSAADGPTTTTTATATVTAPAEPAGTKTLRPTVVKTVRTKTKTRSIVYTPPPQNEFDDGVYEVGSDIPAGQYRTTGGGDCYFAILNSTDTTDIADNNNFSGPQIVTLSDGQYFEADGGCTWSRSR